MDAPTYLTRLLGLGPVGPPDDVEGTLGLLAFHRLEGLALARARERGSEGGLPPEALASLEPAYRRGALATTLCLEAAGRARAALTAVGLPSLLFKGAALVAGGEYADPGARPMDDADLLVRIADAEAAVRALEAAGFRPVVPWTARRAAWCDSLALSDADAPAGIPVAVDLHWRTNYDSLRFGRGGESPLWSGADPDAGLPAPEPHLVLVVEHLLKHLRYRIHLGAYGDVTRLARRVEDWRGVEEPIAGSRLAVAVRAVLAACRTELGAPIPAALTAGVPAALAEALAPRALLGRRRTADGRMAGILDRWRLVGRPGAVLADALDSAFPSRAWLRARYGRSAPVAWLRYVRDVARWSAQRGRSPASPHQELFDPRARE